MAEFQDTSREDAGLRREGEAMTPAELEAWFAREVLPLEATLVRYLQHNWRNHSDITDLRQEVYVRVCEAALKQTPVQPRQFVFTTARNLLIDRVRRERVIPIEAVEDLDALGIAIDEPGVERAMIARETLRHLQGAIHRLPARCQEAVVLKQVNGLSRREIAVRMGISDKMVTEHLTNGMRALADILLGEPSDPRRTP